MTEGRDSSEDFGMTEGTDFGMTKARGKGEMDKWRSRTDRTERTYRTRSEERRRIN